MSCVKEGQRVGREITHFLRSQESNRKLRADSFDVTVIMEPSWLSNSKLEIILKPEIGLGK